MEEGLDLAIKQVKALNFLNDVGSDRDILKFRETVREDGWLRPALISHLIHFFLLGEVEANEVIDKFLGGVTYYENKNK